MSNQPISNQSSKTLSQRQVEFRMLIAFILAAMLAAAGLNHVTADLPISVQTFAPHAAVAEKKQMGNASANRAQWIGEIGPDDFRISNMGPDFYQNYDAYNAQVAYNPMENEFLVVWRGNKSQYCRPSPCYQAFDIWGQRINATTGAEVGENDFRISNLNPDIPFEHPSNPWMPAVSYNSNRNEYLVAFLCTGGICGQRLNAQGEQIGQDDFQILDLRRDDGAMPPFAVLVVFDIGFNPQSNEYLLIWSQRIEENDLTQIYGQRIDGDTGELVGTSAFQISQLSLGWAGAAKIDYNSTANEYLVVFDGLSRPNDAEVFGQRLDAASGAEVGANDFQISNANPNADPSLGAGSPAITFNAARNEYLVVWSQTDVSIDDFTDIKIYGQRLDASGANVGTVNFPISTQASNGKSALAWYPDVTFQSARNEYFVTWAGNVGVSDGRETEVFGQVLDAATGAEIGANDFPLSDRWGSDHSNRAAQLDPKVAYNTTDDQVLVVWSSDSDKVIEGEYEIWGQLYTTRDAPPTLTPTPTLTTFPCADKPAKPNLLAPANKATIGGKKIPLDWTDAICADDYVVTVKQGSKSGTTVWSNTTTTSSAKTKKLAKGSKYFWRVEARNAQGSTFSKWFWFTLQ